MHSSTNLVKGADHWLNYILFTLWGGVCDDCTGVLALPVTPAAPPSRPQACAGSAPPVGAGLSIQLRLIRRGNRRLTNVENKPAVTQGEREEGKDTLGVRESERKITLYEIVK